jgi:tetratricopeptide (TPR) repeat protein
MSIVRRSLIGLTWALVLTACYFHVYRPWHCNSFKKTVLDRTDLAARTGGMRGAVLARKNLEAFLGDRSCGCDLQAMMLEAANLRLLRRPADAIPIYQKALTVERRPEIYLNLALAQLDAGRRADAAASFTQAVRFRPFFISEIPDPDIRSTVEAAVFENR